MYYKKTVFSGLGAMFLALAVVLSFGCLTSESSTGGGGGGGGGIDAPTGVDASDGTYSDRIVVSWNAVSGASYYYIYRSSTATGTYSAIGYVSSSYTSTYNSTSSPSSYPITVGTTYYYAVSAVDSSGNESDLSSYNAGYAASSSSVPTGVNASDGTYTDRIVIGWNAVSGASYYLLYRSTSLSGAYTYLGYVSSSYTSTYNTTSDSYPITVGTTYYYKVSSMNASSVESALSSADSGYASASKGSLKIQNNSTVSISEMYVVVNGSASWGSDLLSGTIAASGNYTLTGLSPGTYDVKLVNSSSTYYSSTIYYNTYGADVTVSAGATSTLTLTNSGFTGAIAVTNTSGATIGGLYISSDYGSTWSGNLLTSSLYSGYYVLFTNVGPGSLYRVKIYTTYYTTGSLGYVVSSLATTTASVTSASSF
jgi:cellulose 1,4-beta-cellobiosidase